MPDLDATLRRIDAATGCHYCEGDLDNSPSNDFCSQDCQELWHNDQATPLDSYHEPWDLVGLDNDAESATYYPFIRQYATLGVTHHVTSNPWAPFASAIQRLYEATAASWAQTAMVMQRVVDEIEQSWTWHDETHIWAAGQTIEIAPYQTDQVSTRNQFGGSTFDLATIDTPSVDAPQVITADMISDIRQAAHRPPTAEVPADVRARALHAHRNARRSW